MSKSVKDTFKGLLEAFLKATTSSMEAAAGLAAISIEEFAKSGNLTFAQAFFDAMPKNYVRRAAFVKWMVAFSPAMMEKDKFSKDKAPNAQALDLEGSRVKPFWEFSPAAEDVRYGPSTVVESMKAAVGKFKTKRYHAFDGKALQTVQAAEEMIEAFEKSLFGSVSAIEAASQPASPPSPAPTPAPAAKVPENLPAVIKEKADDSTSETALSAAMSEAATPAKVEQAAAH